MKSAKVPYLPEKCPNISLFCMQTELLRGQIQKLEFQSEEVFLQLEKTAFVFLYDIIFMSMTYIP